MDNGNGIRLEELQKLDALEQKYSQVNTQMKKLQDDRSDLKNNIKSMNDKFQQVNKNVENILSKLDDIDKNDRNFSENMGNFSVRKTLCAPLRKMTIGVVGSVLAVADKTTELACGAKEGFEDIVAEAQYQRKRKHKASMDEG